MKRFLPITWRTRKTFLRTMAYTFGTLFASWATFIFTGLLLIRYTTFTTSHSFLISLILGIIVMVLGQINRVYPFTYVVTVFSSVADKLKKNRVMLDETEGRILRLYARIEETEKLAFDHLSTKSIRPSYASRSNPKAFKKGVQSSLERTQGYKAELDDFLKTLDRMRNDLSTHEAFVANIDSFLEHPTTPIPNVSDVSLQIQKQVSIIQKELDSHFAFA
ncbi:hypothetical protein [Herpetosiphon geysericola]|uniref:Uncharacterized protein n=1 Tax=Herpetosiphon geysericola TaxID=70996 RepID=A0A0P6XJ98_9CHLR|nr:hypothetical protein [Herpetosiphon geysericola]KPL80223.1 hypothetical protein SE18_24515 [Herpetosiphon geysericola]